MKAIIYLIILMALLVLAVWFGYGVTPQNQWNWLKGYATNTSSQISEQISNTENSAGKLKSRLNDRFDEAGEVYQHSQEQNLPLQNQQ